MKKIPILIIVTAILSALATLAAQPASKRVFICPECGQECDKLVFDKPGKCPGCGMELVEKIDNKEQRISVAVLLFDGAEVIEAYA
jgi:predicted Zn-ribbon and HTH transcriptional regulator